MKEVLTEMSEMVIKTAVARCYGEVSTNPRGKFSFPVGRKFAESVGEISMIASG